MKSLKGESRYGLHIFLGVVSNAHYISRHIQRVAIKFMVVHQWPSGIVSEIDEDVLDAESQLHEVSDSAQACHKHRVNHE